MGGERWRLVTLGWTKAPLLDTVSVVRSTLSICKIVNELKQQFSSLQAFELVFRLCVVQGVNPGGPPEFETLA